MPDEVATEEPLSAFEMPEPATPPSTPVPNGPPPPASPPMLPGMPTINSVSMDLFGADGKGGARGAEAAGYRAKVEGMQPFYAGVQSALDEQERVAQQERPKLPVIAAPPSRGLRDFLAVSENETPVASIAKLLQAMSLFTMSTVGASRHNAVGAMAAFAGAMKGWQEGDAVRADRDFADWEAKTHKALTDYKLQTDDYSRALTASGLSVEGRMRATQLAALGFGDKNAALTAEAGNLESFLGYLTKRDDTYNNYNLKVSDILQKYSDAKERREQEAKKLASTERHQLETERQGRVALDLQAQKNTAANPQEVDRLRDDFVKAAGTWTDVRDAWGRVQASARNPSAAGDLALIFNYMKVLDPKSVVRESEFATAAKAGSYGDRIQGMVNGIEKGTRLSDNQRADFVNRARELASEQYRIHENIENQWTNLAKLRQIDPARAVPDLVGEYREGLRAPKREAEKVQVWERDKNGRLVQRK